MQTFHLTWNIWPGQSSEAHPIAQWSLSVGEGTNWQHGGVKHAMSFPDHVLGMLMQSMLLNTCRPWHQIAFPKQNQLSKWNAQWCCVQPIPFLRPPNSTRLLITLSSTHVLEGCILGGEHDGKPVSILCITLYSHKSDHTFILACHQEKPRTIRQACRHWPMLLLQRPLLKIRSTFYFHMGKQGLRLRMQCIQNCYWHKIGYTCTPDIK